MSEMSDYEDIDYEDTDFEDDFDDELDEFEEEN